MHPDDQLEWLRARIALGETPSAPTLAKAWPAFVELISMPIEGLDTDHATISVHVTGASASDTGRVRLLLSRSIPYQGAAATLGAETVSCDMFFSVEPDVGKLENFMFTTGDGTSQDLAELIAAVEAHPTFAALRNATPGSCVLSSGQG